MSKLGKSVLTRVMQSPIGQKLISLAEKAVTTLEKCLEWSLPTTELSAEANGKPFSAIELERPLPWILFLPTLLILRLLRGAVNIGAQLIGMPTYEPADMVRIIRTARRRLTTMKSEGIRSRRSRSLTSRKLGAVEDRSDTETQTTAGVEANIYSKRKQSDMSSDEEDSSSENEESVIEMVNRLADEPSLEDSDFEPDLSDSEESVDLEDSEEDEGTCLTEIPAEEIEDLKNVTKEMWHDNNKTTRTNKLKSANKQLSLQPEAPQLPTNGIEEEPEINYYSPNSWKSFSPDVSNPFDKQLDHTYTQGKPKEVSNGEVADEKKKKSDDSSSPAVGPVAGDVSNGNLKDKHNATSQAGKQQQHHHHQKNKRGNHGNRKKK